MLRNLSTTYKVGVEQPAALLPGKRLTVELNLAAALNLVLALRQTLR